MNVHLTKRFLHWTAICQLSSSADSESIFGFVARHAMLDPWSAAVGVKVTTEVVTLPSLEVYSNVWFSCSRPFHQVTIAWGREPKTCWQSQTFTHNSIELITRRELYGHIFRTHLKCYSPLLHGTFIFEMNKAIYNYLYNIPRHFFFNIVEWQNINCLFEEVHLQY